MKLRVSLNFFFILGELFLGFAQAGVKGAYYAYVTERPTREVQKEPPKMEKNYLNHSVI